MLTWHNKKFYKDGKEILIRAGSIHYFRTHPDQWYDRLYKLKCCGLNTVETYCCWNIHEPVEGIFNFEGFADIERFIKIADSLGLYVILRPGPYICAEWENGGLPAWLLKNDGIHLRSLDENYWNKMEKYMRVLIGRIKPFLETNGGNIIMVAVENEYGSFGNSREYMNKCLSLLQELGVEVPLFTTDGNTKMFINGGEADGAIIGANFGYANGVKKEYFDEIAIRRPDTPFFHTEHWIGGFDHWGDKQHKYSAQLTANEVKQQLEQDISFILYMFHGGTNFGFYNGANSFPSKENNMVDIYYSDVTSYDYDALLTEWGECTEKYFAVQKVIGDYLGQELPKPAMVETQSIGEVELNKKASLFDNLNNIGKHFKDDIPYNMEHYDQDYGYILYRCEIKTEQPIALLALKNINDRCHVYFNGIYRGTVDRNMERTCIEPDGWMDKGGVLELLVENQGRINFGPAMLHGDRKGICDLVYVWGKQGPRQLLCDWDIYTLPMKELEKLSYTGDRLPAFFSGCFKAQPKKDCFVHLDNFTKGFVVVNGFNLGRYWNIGPQLSLYIPGPILEENNEIIVFEEEKVIKPTVSVLDYHTLGGKQQDTASTVF